MSYRGAISLIVVLQPHLRWVGHPIVAGDILEDPKHNLAVMCEILTKARKYELYSATSAKPSIESGTKVYFTNSTELEYQVLSCPGSLTI